MCLAIRSDAPPARRSAYHGHQVCHWRGWRVLASYPNLPFTLGTRKHPWHDLATSKVHLLCLSVKTSSIFQSGRGWDYIFGWLNHFRSSTTSSPTLRLANGHSPSQYYPLSLTSQYFCACFLEEFMNVAQVGRSIDGGGKFQS